MSYDIQLFRREVQELEQQQDDLSFFENQNNLLPFTSAQYDGLHQRLLIYGYEVVGQYPDRIEFELVQEDAATITATLWNNALYFSVSPTSTEDIFDIGMTASEFTDGGDLAKYDPQVGGWEVLED